MPSFPIIATSRCVDLRTNRSSSCSVADGRQGTPALRRKGNVHGRALLRPQYVDCGRSIGDDRGVGVRPNLKFKLARYAPKARTLWGLCPGGALTSPTGGQLVQASQDKCLPPIRMLDVIQLQIGQPPQQRANCDFSLDAGRPPPPGRFCLPVSECRAGGDCRQLSGCRFGAPAWASTVRCGP